MSFHSKYTRVLRFEFFRVPLQRKEQHSKPQKDNLQLLERGATPIQLQPCAHTPQPRQLVREISAFLLDPDDTEGYMYALVNTVVQVVGQVMVKMYGGSLQAWEINLIRFGSAAVQLDIALIAVAAGYRVFGPDVVAIRMEEAKIGQLAPSRAIALRQPRSCASQVPLYCCHYMEEKSEPETLNP